MTIRRSGVQISIVVVIIIIIIIIIISFNPKRPTVKRRKRRPVSVGVQIINREDRTKKSEQYTTAGC